MAQCDEGQLQCTAEKVYEAPVFVRVCVFVSLPPYLGIWAFYWPQLNR